MEITMTIGNPGTTLSCATWVDAVAGQGIGLRGAQENVLPAGIPARQLLLATRNRGFGVEVVPTATDMPAYKQPKIHVPHPPLERSP